MLCETDKFHYLEETYMDYEKIGALIRSLRTQQGLTQRELAQQLTVSDKAVSKWERGQGCPDVSLLPSLARFWVWRWRACWPGSSWKMNKPEEP